MSDITIKYGQYDDGSVWAECDECGGGRRFPNATAGLIWGATEHECEETS